jgi:hypothetical protein
VAWSWYGVKSLYETVVDGDSSDRLVEERVVLVKARSASEAIGRAEREAREYTNGLRYKNRDGQTVITRPLGALDAFSLTGSPASGSEVYSSQRVVDSRMNNKRLFDLLIGPERTSADDEGRRKYEPDAPADSDD